MMRLTILELGKRSGSEPWQVRTGKIMRKTDVSTAKNSHHFQINRLHNKRHTHHLQMLIKILTYIFMVFCFYFIQSLIFFCSRFILGLWLQWMYERICIANGRQNFIWFWLRTRLHATNKIINTQTRLLFNWLHRNSESFCLFRMRVCVCVLGHLGIL